MGPAPLRPQFPAAAPLTRRRRPFRRRRGGDCYNLRPVHLPPGRQDAQQDPHLGNRKLRSLAFQLAGRISPGGSRTARGRPVTVVPRTAAGTVVLLVSQVRRELLPGARSSTALVTWLSYPSEPSGSTPLRVGPDEDFVGHRRIHQWSATAVGPRASRHDFGARHYGSLPNRSCAESGHDHLGTCTEIPRLDSDPL